MEQRLETLRNINYTDFSFWQTHLAPLSGKEKKYDRRYSSVTLSLTSAGKEKDSLLVSSSRRVRRKSRNWAKMGAGKGYHGQIKCSMDEGSMYDSKCEANPTDFMICIMRIMQVSLQAHVPFISTALKLLKTAMPILHKYILLRISFQRDCYHLWGWVQSSTS